MYMYTMYHTSADVGIEKFRGRIFEDPAHVQCSPGLRKDFKIYLKHVSKNPLWRAVNARSLVVYVNAYADKLALRAVPRNVHEVFSGPALRAKLIHGFLRV